MFYRLHRMVRWFWWGMLALGVVWLYRQREVLEPLYVWYEVYDNGGLQKTDSLPARPGRGVTVLDGHTFQMKSEGKIYSVRLTGFEVPTSLLAGADLELEHQRRAFLRQTVLSNDLTVKVTFESGTSLLGIVQAAGTNLNTHYVRSGLSRFNREYVKSIPREDQFLFFAAARQRAKDRALRESLALSERDAAP